MALTANQIKDLWIKAGGNPQQADKAVEIAMAVSGGDPNYVRANSDGTVDRGLWGINSTYGHQSTTDPLANARAAVAASRDGSEWSMWSSLSDRIAWLQGSQSTSSSVLSDIFGIDLSLKFIGYVAMMLVGAGWMAMAVVLFVLSSKRFRRMAAFTAEVVGSGIGFGIGARATDAIIGDRSGANGESTSPAPTSAPPSNTPAPPALPPGPPVPTSRRVDDPTLKLPFGGDESPTVPLPTVSTTKPSSRRDDILFDLAFGRHSAGKATGLSRHDKPPYTGKHRRKDQP